MDICSNSIAKLKEAFAEKAELTSDECMESLSLKTLKEVEEVVNQSRIYEISKDLSTITKKSIIRFKLIVMKSEDDEIHLPIANFVEPILKIFSNIPYIRFNKNIGQVVVFEEDFLKVLAPFSTIFKVIDAEKSKEYQVSFHDSTFDDRRSFSNEHSKHMEGILRYKYGRQTHFAVDGVTIYKNGIYLGPQKFKSIKELQSFFGKLLKNNKDGAIINEPESSCLRELLKYHMNSDKKMENIKHFEVGFHPKYPETKCFLIVRKDDSKEDFSFNKCIKQIGTLIK